MARRSSRSPPAEDDDKKAAAPLLLEGEGAKEALAPSPRSPTDCGEPPEPACRRVAASEKELVSPLRQSAAALTGACLRWPAVVADVPGDEDGAESGETTGKAGPLGWAQSALGEAELRRVPTERAKEVAFPPSGEAEDAGVPVEAAALRCELPLRPEAASEEA